MPDIKFVVWPDTHVPNENKRAVRTALKILEWYQPHTVVVLGDFMDMEPVSHWLSSKRKTSEGLRLAKDYQAANILLDKITANCKRLVYITGNHERFVDDALERNPEFDGLINVSVGLKFEERRKAGLDLIYKEKYGQCWNLGKLWFTHGSYTTTGHAKKHVEAYERNIVYGHCHDLQLAIKTSPLDVDNKHMGLSLGCLADKNPDYMQNKPNNWVHCVGVGLSRSNGSFNIDPIIINSGVASYAGLTFKG